MELVRTVVTIMFAIVTEVLLGQTVNRLTIAITRIVQIVEDVKPVDTILFVIVTEVLLGQTVKQLIIAITRTVLVTAHVTTNTTRTNVHVVWDT